MPTDPVDRRLLIGHDLEATRQLGASLGLPIQSPPTLADAPTEGWDWPWRDALATWGEELRSAPQPDAVVVCTWPEPTPAIALVDLGHRRWIDQVELPVATWFTAVSAAASLCADGGSVVVVAERPAALDCLGRSDMTALAEGLAALTRSAALIHGPRRCRVNLVTTELFSAPDTLLGMPPPLPSFPGSPGNEIAGAVEMLWSPAAAGVTGTVVRADCGRAW
jgi:NAD(P)-dependent dehydrogenase (short-subunit alcohol dehydrogenase family)